MRAQAPKGLLIVVKKIDTYAAPMPMPQVINKYTNYW